MNEVSKIAYPTLDFWETLELVRTEFKMEDGFFIELIKIWLKDPRAFWLREEALICGA